MLLRPATSVHLVSTSFRQKRIQSIILIRIPEKGVYQSPRTYWFPLKIKHLGSHAESCWHIHQTRLEWAVHQLCESPVSTSYFLLWTIGQFHIVILCSHGDFHDYDNPQYVIKPTAFLEAAQVSLSQTNSGTKAVVCINFAHQTASPFSAGAGPRAIGRSAAWSRPCSKPKICAAS